MGPLPRIDLPAIWIRDLLHRGKRDEALERINQLIAEGKAGTETLKLAEYLRTAKRGRQPFGATHLWYDIGLDNDDLRTNGVNYEERIAELCAKYMLAKTQIETAIAKFEDGMRAIREENHEG